MDVKVNEVPEKKVKRFPKLMKDEVGNIILFNSRGVGVAIKHSLYYTGTVIKQKDLLSCEDFEGEVTLSN